MAKAQRLSLTLPAGTAAYPKINKPDTEEYGGDYKTKTVVPLEKAKPIVQQIRAFAKANFAPAQLADAKFRWPYKANKEEGTVEFFPRSDYKPAVFDVKGNEVANPPMIGGGTILKVGVTVTPNSPKAKAPGLKMYLNSVQLLKLVEYVPQSRRMASAEDEVEGGYVAGDETEGDIDGDTSPSTTGQAGGRTTADDLDDDDDFGGSDASDFDDEAF